MARIFLAMSWVILVGSGCGSTENTDAMLMDIKCGGASNCICGGGRCYDGSCTGSAKNSCYGCTVILKTMFGTCATNGVGTKYTFLECADLDSVSNCNGTLTCGSC